MKLYFTKLEQKQVHNCVKIPGGLFWFERWLVLFVLCILEFGQKGWLPLSQTCANLNRQRGKIETACPRHEPASATPQTQINQISPRRFHFFPKCQQQLETPEGVFQVWAKQQRPRPKLAPVKKNSLTNLAACAVTTSGYCIRAWNEPKEEEKIN